MCVLSQGKCRLLWHYSPSLRAAGTTPSALASLFPRPSRAPRCFCSFYLLRRAFLPLYRRLTLLCPLLFQDFLSIPHSPRPRIYGQNKKKKKVIVLCHYCFFFLKKQFRKILTLINWGTVLEPWEHCLETGYLRIKPRRGKAEF